ncbi:MAG TPA: GTP-binding protein [Bordetella sp.]
MATTLPASPPARMPVTLVTGFLGSGKTTLVNAVLRSPGFAGSLVIVNEFGDVGLDHLLIASASDQVVLLDSGCLCCAASGSLRDTLIDIYARIPSGGIPAFDRIIVETSGLAHPGPLVAQLIGDSALNTRCALAQVLTLVDAQTGAATLARYAEARHQAAFADRLVISKVDAAASENIDSVRQALAAINPDAALAAWHRALPAAPLFLAGEAGGQTMLERPEVWLHNLMRAQPREHSPGFLQGVHDAAFGQIGSCVLRPAQAPIDWATYAHWTATFNARFGPRLLRCKGLLPLGDDGRPWIVQGVQGYFAPPERLAAWPAGCERGFLVCIGDGIDPAELQAVIAPGLGTPTLPSPAFS